MLVFPSRCHQKALWVTGVLTESSGRYSRRVRCVCISVFAGFTHLQGGLQRKREKLKLGKKKKERKRPVQCHDAYLFHPRNQPTIGPHTHERCLDNAPHV